MSVVPRSGFSGKCEGPNLGLCCVELSPMSVKNLFSWSVLVESCVELSLYEREKFLFVVRTGGE